jgi:oxalate decarboxylase/phosphoglucose isomerase-like protein (cupin superfamily)
MEIRPSFGKGFPYDAFVERENVPVHEAVVGVDDVLDLPRGWWERLGGNGTFIRLQGTFQAQRGLYVVEIPGGGALHPQKQLYEQQLFPLTGRGVTEVWQGRGPKLTFEWSAGSVFAIPRNLPHRLYNASLEPAVLLGVTTAPQVIDSLVDPAFVFDCEYDFFDLYASNRSGESYFSDPGVRTVEGRHSEVIWHTNFIPDARRALLDDLENKVSCGQLTGYRMGSQFPQGHISQWPPGRYHKAHYHGPGAVLLGLDGEGYVLAWPSEWGPHPYESGRGSDVFKVNWQRNSIYSPPNGYFHQHFNSGSDPAKHIAVYGSYLPLGAEMFEGGGEFRGYTRLQDGGTLIDYEDEDPHIRLEFESELRRKGIACSMPVVARR